MNNKRKIMQFIIVTLCILLYLFIFGLIIFEQYKLSRNIKSILPDDNSSLQESSEIKSEVMYDKPLVILKPTVDVIPKAPEDDKIDNTENDLINIGSHIHTLTISQDEDIEMYFIKYKKYYDYKYETWVNITIPEEWQRFIFYKCVEHDVPYEIILGIMGIETGFDYGYRLSPNGLYYGPGMISIEYTYDYLKKRGVNLYTTNGAIEAICIVFRDKLNDFNNDIEKALIAYNCGTYGAQKLFNQGKSSTFYSERVFQIVDGLYRYKEEFHD